jgi:cysteine desulfurase / selenocysteine lyase
MFSDDFPILQQTIQGKRLVYLDSASSSQKPQSVIDCIQNYYCHDNANVYRGVHALSERATRAYEHARVAVQHFIHAAHCDEIIFTHGTTDAINLVANSFGELSIKKGDEIIISEMEHHANIVPWQVLCQRTGAVLRVIPVLEDGTLDMSAFSRLLNSKTRLVAVMHVSNVLGTINPVQSLIEIAHKNDIPVLIDGAQAVAHLPVDVQDLDCDFYVFSSQKLYGPTGLGVLYGKRKWLKQMPPYQTGGGMISQVTFEKTEYAQAPNKFEAGTPHIAGAIGLHTAIEYIEKIGFKKILNHEKDLTEYMLESLKKMAGLRLIGTAPARLGVFSFVMDCAHPHDIATVLDQEGVAVRAGHHCTMPLMKRFAVPATVRASLAIYNRMEDIDCLMVALNKVTKLFGVSR